MSDTAMIRRLSKAIKGANRNAKFCVGDTLPAIDPGIHVEDLGALALPLKQMSAKHLFAASHVAAYGQGTQTLVDTKVRKTFEIDSSKVRLSDEWNSTIASATQQVAIQLGLPEEQLEAQLYKLLIYKTGGFFRPHRDSEKLDGMVASLIVVLPNNFRDGALVIRHGTATQTFDFKEAAQSKSACYAAFYSDCEHEVQRVTRGVRLCLAYNLVLKPDHKKRSKKTELSGSMGQLPASIAEWTLRHPAEPLVFALEHQYTQRGLSLNRLKGADRSLADLIIEAADKADCRLHMAQVLRHTQQWADDGSYGRWNRRYSHRDNLQKGKLELGIIYEEELHGVEWTSIDGKKQPFGEIDFEVSSVVSSVPMQDWKPTSEDFEGYTGNAGNTLDRWYRRSAIVVWHRDHHFDVVAGGGADESVTSFCKLTAKLAKTPRTRLEAERADCIRFARAIIARWPSRMRGYGHDSSREKLLGVDFPKHLLMLHDRDLVAEFLRQLADKDRATRLDSFITKACREFGWATFTMELKLFFAPPADGSYDRELPIRELEWLSKFCCDKSTDPDKSTVSRELCALAVGRFCEPRPSRYSDYGTRERLNASACETSLPLLVQALLASGRDDLVARVMQFVATHPTDFTLDYCHVPSLKSLSLWSRKFFGNLHPQLAEWLDTVRRQLESATSQPPTPPTDWRRPADVECGCEFCSLLNPFLSHPRRETVRIQAREDIRQHLIHTINRHQCDLQHSLDRDRRPYALILNKTTDSYEQAVKRFHANLKLLEALPMEA